jgi:pyrimidine operon attenuation protein/uracil phosphoribosyltransferase
MDILNHQQIEIKTQRMACEIAECYAQEQELTLCGLNERGYYLAQRLAQEIGKFTPHLKINLIQVQTLDGVSFEPVSSFAKKHILLIDDVINSGRTLMDVMDDVYKDKPASIRTAFLAKREHRAFPVKADFVGISLATTLKEHVFFDNSNAKKLKVYLK